MDNEEKYDEFLMMIHKDLKQLLEDKDKNLKWLIEHNHNDYLTWIALWLACMLGIVTILTGIVKPNTLTTASHLVLILFMYWVLVSGMIFSVWRLINIVEKGVRWMNQLEDEALKTELKGYRGSLSEFVVGDDGEIRQSNRYFIVLVHGGVAIVLFLLSSFQTALEVGLNERIAGLFGLFFQVVGVSVVFGAQVVFYFRARKEYGSTRALAKAFLDMGGGRFGFKKGELKKLDSEETEKRIKEFPLSQFLRDDFIVTAVGLVLTLVGLIVETIGSFL